ncbi:hypothetical protein NDU88_000185 [Pleurodeles waltl]|uniref:Uncharacterized protein n=1 Tax=Pleurodeles waltl TaxID=8319 RepID=A0AAV7PZH4_PLEWA|nr:hypothetical protein NDU88_000185 [Pleurodeles waltl]
MVTCECHRVRRKPESATERGVNLQEPRETVTCECHRERRKPASANERHKPGDSRWSPWGPEGVLAGGGLVEAGWTSSGPEGVLADAGLAIIVLLVESMLSTDAGQVESRWSAWGPEGFLADPGGFLAEPS